MDYEETMVEQDDNGAADDALSEDVVEEADESEESLESLDGDEGEPAQEEQPKQGSQGTSEPGWIRQRVDKAVQKALANQREEIRAEYEAQFAPLKARLLEMDAQELLRSGKVKDIETARELVRYRNGQPQQAGQAPRTEAQPRNNRGQYMSAEDAATSARIDMLRYQADKIRAEGGPDVIAEFQQNEEVKQKIIAGEMDFYDVKARMEKNRRPSRRPPSPMRSPNGASGTNPNAIDSMSDEQFERLEKRIKEGARIRLTK